MAGFGACAAITLGASLFLMTKLGETRQNAAEMSELASVRMAGSAQASEYIRGVSSAARALILTHISEKDREKQNESLDKYWTKCYEGVDLMEKGGVAPEKIEEARTALKGWEDASRECVELAEKGDYEGATEYMLGGARDIRGTAEKAIEGLHTESLESIETLDKASTTEYETAKKAGFGAMFFAVLSAVLLALGVSKSIGKPLAQANEVFARVGEGDLTVRMAEDGPDELAKMGRAANHMLDNLRELIGVTVSAARRTVIATTAMDKSSQEAAAASTEIASAIEQVAQGAGNLAATSQSALEATESLLQNINEVSRATDRSAGALSSVEASQSEMNRAIELVAGSAKAAAEGSRVAADAAKEGKDVVGECVSAMRRLQSTNETAAEHIQLLGTESQRIGVIVQSIDEIAEQTNLLALNAAIEAARAGDQGRGFAVVAEEVRKLAERSSNQTTEIGELIATLQKIVGEAVEMTLQGSAEVEKSAEMVDQAGQTLERIEAAVSEAAAGMAQSEKASADMQAASASVAQAIEELSASSTQVAAAIEGMTAQSHAVSSNIEQTAAIGQESAASAEEVTATAQAQTAMMEEISSESEGLRLVVNEIEDAVSRFKVEASAEDHLPETEAALDRAA